MKKCVMQHEYVRNLEGVQDECKLYNFFDEPKPKFEIKISIFYMVEDMDLYLGQTYLELLYNTK